MIERLPLVGVLGSGRDEWPERSGALGRWLAERSCHLLTGGGAGVMAATSRAFATTPERIGSVIGILPGSATTGEPPPGYPNPWVEVVIRTHLPGRGGEGAMAGSRNHLVVLSATVLVALPGGAGTRSEIELASRYGRDLVVWLESDDEMPGLDDDVERASSLDAVGRFVNERLRCEAQPGGT